jgi:hypothetical protein
LGGGATQGDATLYVNFGGSGSANTVARSDHNHDGSYWKLGGNSGTNPSVNFLGTTDETALELRANNARILRLEPNATSPNLIGGSSGNMVTSGVYGATISGGGVSSYPNRVTDNYGTVGGGERNQAGNADATLYNAFYATVGGGVNNRASASYATVGGGGANQANASFATVGGGYQNEASANLATIGGGYYNQASAQYATVGGGIFNQASAQYATIAGGGFSDPSYPWTTSNRVTDDYGTVGGGGNNQAGDNAGDTTDKKYGTVSGGESNTASGTHATVGGGNSNTADGDYATVGGGDDNTASSGYATVGGGRVNTATGYHATVAGGENNEASGHRSAVGGGIDNMASGNWATVAGGNSNTAAGDYSFAAGRRAKANHPGDFVWADSNDFDFASTVNNQFSVRATGGVRFVLGIDEKGNPTWTCGSTGGAWSCSSDRALKENLVLAEPQQALQQLAKVPVYYWNAKGGGARHIGPMAQDFAAAFAVGENNISLATIDLDGVALASIQGLYAENQELKAQVEDLEARLTTLEQTGGAAQLPLSSQSNTWLLLAGLGLAGILIYQRRRTRGGQP